MSRKYKFKKADDSWSKDIGLSALMTVAAVKVVQGKGPFSITQDGDVIVKQLSRTETLTKLRAAVKNRPIGPVFRVRKKSGDIAFVCRAVTDLVDESNSTSGNRNADIFWNWVRAEFKAYNPRFAGAYVCKSVSGSTTLSQHSYGNAVDVFFDTLTQQERVWDAVRTGKCPVGVAHAISMRHIWSPSSGVQYYGGDFHGHIHVDFLPQYSGGCGVRG